MKIIEIDTKQFNALKFDRREFQTKSESGSDMKKVMDWYYKMAVKSDIYKYKRPNGILWMVRVDGKPT